MVLTGVGAGIAANADPGPGNIDPGKEGSITLHKYSGAPVDPERASDGTAVTVPTGPSDPNKPLAGVKFTLYKVDGLDVTNPADWPDITELNDWVVDKGAAGSWLPGATIGGDSEALPPVPGYNLEVDSTVTTDENGKIVWGKGEDGNEDSDLALGVYLIAETGAPANVAEHTLPFLVTVPLAHNADNTWIYDVNVYPKNAIIDVEKTVKDPGSVGVGSNVEWTITDKVAETQRAYEYYNLFDLLDARLQYVTDSTVLEYDGEELVNGTDYYLTVGPKAAADDRQSLRIDFTQKGLDKIEQGGGTLTWNFKTTVLTIGDGLIYNQATVYPNKPGSDWGIGGTPPITPPTEKPEEPTEPPTETPPGEETNKPVSKWGAVKIWKYSGYPQAPMAAPLSETSAPLEGAVFQVFATKAHADACVVSVEADNNSLPAGCDDAIAVTRDANGNEIPEQDKFTTGEDGAVTIPGLSAGINEENEYRPYYIVEIVPPAGFVNRNEVYVATVSPSAPDATVEIIAHNPQQPATGLPSTGGAGTAALVFGALALAGIAVGVNVNSRRKAAVK